MNEATAFPFAELTAAAREGSPDDTRKRLPEDDTEHGARHLVFSAFDPLAPGAREPSEAEGHNTVDDLANALEEARREAARETEAALRAAFANDVEQRRADLFASIREQLERQGGAFEQELARLAAVAHRLAIAFAKAVIPRTIERQPLADVTDLMTMALRQLAGEPSIELRLPPDLVEIGEELCTELAQETGFPGRIQFLADPDLSQGDAEIRWRGGVIDRRIDHVQAEALRLADQLLHQAPEPQSDDGGDALDPGRSGGLSSQLEVGDQRMDEPCDEQ